MSALQPGQIVKAADPTLSAPSPTYPGNTITSSGGAWTSCGDAITGFYKEWLRDGAVVNGPTFVASAPGRSPTSSRPPTPGHWIPRPSALQRRRLLQRLRVELERGRAASCRRHAAAATATAAGPPPPMQLYFDEGFDYSVTDESGNLVSQQSMDNLPDGSYEISHLRRECRRLLCEHGTAAIGQHHRRNQLVLARRGREALLHGRQAPDGARCHHAGGGLEVSPQGALVCHVPGHRRGSLTVDSFFTNIDPLFQVDWDDHGTGWWYTWRGSPTGGHYSRRQGKIDNCILKWGCIGSHYPQIEIWVNGNGAWAAK